MNLGKTDAIRTARLTGIWYLLMAITGILGFMVFDSKIYVSTNPGQTLKNLVELQSTARIRLLLELGVVVSQALTAAWFYKLFRRIDEWSAWTLGIFGIVNSVVIMVSAISMGVAIKIAISSTQNGDNKVLLIELLQNISSHSWAVGGLFFGLWLFPMAKIIIKSKCMPIWLGRVILIGGIGYLLTTTLTFAGISFQYKRLLILPATVGEFWMIGYLLIFGIRERCEV